MNLEEYAQQQRQQGAGQDFAPHPERQRSAPPPDNSPTAQKIIAEYKLSHEIAEGCRLQILQDIKPGANLVLLLLTAAEAISRLDYKGDTFYLQVKEKLKQAGFNTDPRTEELL